MLHDGELEDLDSKFGYETCKTRTSRKFLGRGKLGCEGMLKRCFIGALLLRGVKEMESEGFKGVVKSG